MDLAGIIVGAVIGVAGIATAVLVYRYERRRTSVDFSVLTDIRLIRSTGVESFSDLIEVSYNKRKLTHPRVVDVKVTNTGNTPIRGPEAYVKPIVLELDDGRQPIEAAILAASPEGVVDEIFETQPNGTRAVALRPTLLNAGDWFVLRMLFDNDHAKVVGSHRIEAAPAMKRLTPEQMSGHRRVVSTALSGTAFICLSVGAVGGFLTKNLAAGISYTSAAFLVLGPLAGLISWRLLPKEAKELYPQ